MGISIVSINNNRISKTKCLEFNSYKVYNMLPTSQRVSFVNKFVIFPDLRTPESQKWDLYPCSSPTNEQH